MRYTIPLTTRKKLKNNSLRCTLLRHCDKNIIPFFFGEAERPPDKHGEQRVVVKRDNDSNESYPWIGWSRRVPISALESRHIRRKLHAQSVR